MAKVYIGEEKKFAINLSAQGFSMDDNDFDIEVVVAGQSEKGNKANSIEGSPIVIFSEDVTPQEGDPFKQWFGIIDTSVFDKSGESKVIATAYVPDTHADDGIRKEIAVSKELGQFVLP
jgi:hypothetical protein